MIKNILNLGDAAAYCDFGSEVNETINNNVINYFNKSTIASSKLSNLKLNSVLFNLSHAIF